MDNEASMETKTNDNDYIPFESIVYSLELNDVQLVVMCFTFRVTFAELGKYFCSDCVV